MTSFFDYFLHLNLYINQLIEFFGLWSYLIIFLIIFLECGCVLTPFLPGESLLFSLGILTRSHYISFFYTFIILTFAAIVGNYVNYLFGKYLGKYFVNSKSKKFNFISKKPMPFIKKKGISP